MTLCWQNTLLLLWSAACFNSLEICKVGGCRLSEAKYTLGFRLNSQQWNELFLTQLPPAKNNLYLTMMLDSNSGKELLSDLGEIVRLPDGRNGREAIKTGLFKASANLLEFTPINVLRIFPGDIYIDLEEVLKVLHQSEKLTKSEIAFTKHFYLEMLSTAFSKYI